MLDATSAMARECRQSPAVVAAFLVAQSGTLESLGARLRALKPKVIATSARGSSDHAANFFKYAAELTLGLPVASIGPSIASVYDAPIHLDGGALVSISQSGRSPDIIALQKKASAGGAFSISIVNDVTSPLATSADAVVDLGCGPELSVAATKSFIASCVAGAALVAATAEDAALQAALQRLPTRLEEALAADWSSALEPISSARSLYVVGRGPGFSIAQEGALKLKEVGAIHAEAFSTAEVMHGPLRLVENGFPILAFLPEDKSLDSARAALDRLEKAGGRIFAVSPSPVAGQHLPVPATGHGITDAIVMAAAFYAFVETVSRARGFDPDHPTHLAKVTETR